MTNADPRLPLWQERLRGIAQTGLAFSPSQYDRERYIELLKLAAQMEMPPEGAFQENQNRLAEEYLAAVAPGPAGYITPKVGCGAIVFNASDELLLVNRADSRGWFLPAGFADLGYTPAQIAAKETLEETGLQVTPLKLVGIYDNRLHGGLSGIHLYRVLFYCRLDGGALRGHPLETRGIGFFPRVQLPEPLLGGS